MVTQVTTVRPVDTVVVYDDFRNADIDTTHGELVEKELTGQGHICEATPTNDRRQVDVGVSMAGIEQQRAEGLSDYVREHFVKRMNSTAEALRAEVDNGARRVVSQSQGASESRAVQALFYRARDHQSFRVKLEQQLGLENSGDRELLQSLLDTVARVHRNDPDIATARSQLEQASAAADEVGILRVVSAGNQGALYRTITEMGLEVGPEFFRNELATATTIVVGAADGDRAADLASPMAGAVVAADGVERELCVDGELKKHSGSSYAQPQVARRADEMLIADPGITRNRVVAFLEAMATPVPGFESQLGAGILLDG